MTDILKGFVPVKQVAEQFDTSRSTLDRRRVKAQQGSDDSVLKQFLLRTRDGEVHEAPSRERVQQFIKAGRVPEWFVSKAWLRREYGERKAEEDTETEKTAAQPAGNSAAYESAITALKHQYEERIGDLKQQLQQEREEKQQLLQYAQSDKQLFGNAVSNLTKVLTLPGMASAIDTANRQLAGTASAEPSTKNRGESTSEKPEQKRQSNGKPTAKQKKASQKKKHWFGFGRR